MPAQGVRENLPCLTTKTKPTEELRFAASVGVIGRKQVLSDFNFFYDCLIRVR